MVDIVTKGGKKIGRLSDSCDVEDTIIVQGQEKSLEDAYNSPEVKKAFNAQVKELKDDSSEQ